MKRQDIVRMTNQIADFHRPYPREEAVAGVAQHIIDFWDPRMRADLATQLAEDEAGFDELALAGAKRAAQKQAAHA
ncbi:MULTISPECIES: formate dehydrogenase subunit delta [Thalassobaculum]|uniref:Formate dehydrogenase subunit delta n=1 Tax=Thalassobaculum litoreum DSM 18839 TaxID=1123362 RepID=A0A8G2EWS6_9PROT|nr:MULTISPECIES: formate dehydrogenase subunit delta [Thalassobaculum]SDG42432.1 formate dehydrogenase subunit delta [Thalassobaculum litoreum DSM 18839]